MFNCSLQAIFFRLVGQASPSAVECEVCLAQVGFDTTHTHTHRLLTHSDSRGCQEAKHGAGTPEYENSPRGRLKMKWNQVRIADISNWFHI